MRSLNRSRKRFEIESGDFVSDRGEGITHLLEKATHGEKALRCNKQLSLNVSCISFSMINELSKHKTSYSWKPADICTFSTITGNNFFPFVRITFLYERLCNNCDDKVLPDLRLYNNAMSTACFPQSSDVLHEMQFVVAKSTIEDECFRALKVLQRASATSRIAQFKREIFIGLFSELCNVDKVVVNILWLSYC